MDTSFYTAARGAMTHQERMNVIANNLSNLNTTGYKAQTSVFMDLMYYNMRASQGQQTNLKAGTGVMQNRTNIDFSTYGIQPTQQPYDYAISGEGFFMVRDPGTNEISYTRNGHFSLSKRGNAMYLITDNGKLALDANRNPIRVENGTVSADPAVFTFANTNGMQASGNNEFTPIQRNGNPILMTNADVRSGYLEMSNVNMANEMSETIRASKGYAYALKMVQTSDEVEQTINSLRG